MGRERLGEREINWINPGDLSLSGWGEKRREINWINPGDLSLSGWGEKRRNLCS